MYCCLLCQIRSFVYTPTKEIILLNPVCPDLFAEYIMMGHIFHVVCIYLYHTLSPVNHKI